MKKFTIVLRDMDEVVDFIYFIGSFNNRNLYYYDTTLRYDVDEIREGLTDIYYGETYENTIEVNLTDQLGAFTSWLGGTSTRDIEIMVEKLSINEDPKYMDSIFYRVYDQLDDAFRMIDKDINDLPVKRWNSKARYAIWNNISTDL